MNVLLLRLSGPLQAWGVQSRFSIRDTGLEPSKSGVIGLLCAALGRPRAGSLADLAALSLGVRVDREGRMTYDFQTAQHVLKAAGGLKDTEPSRRYYLADACFLAGLEGEDLDLLRQLHEAMRSPVWPLSLGRKAFVPGEPVYLPDGLQPGRTLAEALDPVSYPWLGSPPSPERPWLLGTGSLPPGRLRLVLEDTAGVEIRQDQPAASFADRRFAPRRVTTRFIDLPQVAGATVAG